MVLNTKRKGFTLSELLVVILIIGILAAIAVPMYGKAIKKSRASDALHVLSVAAERQESFFVNNGKYAKSFSELSAPIKGLNAAEGTSSKIGNFSYEMQKSCVAASRTADEYTIYKNFVTQQEGCVGAGCIIIKDIVPTVSSAGCDMVNGETEDSPGEPPVGPEDPCVATPSACCPTGTEWSTDKNKCVAKNPCSEGKIYNPSTKTCICNNTCIGEGVQNAETCACSCPATCPLAGQVRDASCNCACPAAKPNWNGTACSANCSAPKTRWTGTECACPLDKPIFSDGACIKCPSHLTFDGTSCACPDGLPHEWSGACYACSQSSFNTGKTNCADAFTGPVGVFTEIMCSCACNEIGSALKNGKCVCVNPTPVWTGSVCEKCPDIQEWDGKQCVCPTDKPVWTGTVCESCESNKAWNATTKTCECSTETPYWDAVAGTCVNCTGDNEWNGTKCECKKTCLEHQTFDPVACTCKCKETDANGNCKCPDEKPFWDGTKCKGCDLNGQVYENGKCVCQKPRTEINGACICMYTKPIYNSSTNTCEHCPGDTFWGGKTSSDGTGTCEPCDGGRKIVFLEGSDLKHCSCPAPQTKWSGPEGKCICPDETPFYSGGKCNGCPEGEELRRKYSGGWECFPCSGDQKWDSSTKSCKCLPPRIAGSSTSGCYCPRENPVFQNNTCNKCPPNSISEWRTAGGGYFCKPCPAGTVVDTMYGSDYCRCPDGMNMQNNGKCVCDRTSPVYNSVTGKCEKCPAGQVGAVAFDGNKYPCKSCPSGMEPEDLGAFCRCKAPRNTSFTVTGNIPDTTDPSIYSCDCPKSVPEYNASNNTCNPCTGGKVGFSLGNNKPGYFCACPSSKPTWSEKQQQCVCDNEK